MMGKPLVEIQWELEFYKTINNARGDLVDMYWLTEGFDGTGVSIGVPHGRRDVAEFMLRACQAGQQVLQRAGEFAPKFR